MAKLVVFLKFEAAIPWINFNVNKGGPFTVEHVRGERDPQRARGGRCSLVVPRDHTTIASSPLHERG